MTKVVYPGSGRFRSVPGDPETQVRDAEWRTTPTSAVGSSPQAAADLREAHLSRRHELIRQLGYPSMKLLSGEKL